MKIQRVSRETLFAKIAELVAQRSTCPRASVGAVAVQQGRIVATAYNGAPSGMPHCTEVGCEIQVETKSGDTGIQDVEQHCIRAVHAEANLIAWSARMGVALKESKFYLTHRPCYDCAKLIINAGVQEVHISTPYGHGDGLELLKSKILVWEVPTAP